MVGINLALYSMLLREKSIFIIKSNYISDSDNLPEDYFIEITLDLIDCKYNNDNIQLTSVETRINNAKLLLSTSEELFNNKEYDKVECFLDQGLIMLDMNLSNNSIYPLKHSYYYILTENNYQLKQWEKTIYYSNLYLYDEVNISILYWKSIALINICDFEQAKENLNQILSIQPDYIKALDEIKNINNYIEKNKKKEIKLYKKMLNL